MNPKGRKAYETEISELNRKLTEANNNARMYRTMSESVTKDLLSLIAPRLIPSLKSLFKFRKEYRKVLKNEKHNRTV